MASTVQQALERHEQGAREAFAIFQTYAPGSPRVPGMDTVARMAVRLDHGRDVEEAAAREYLYRWNLSLDYHASSRPGRRQNVFASHYAPHAIGL